MSAMQTNTVQITINQSGIVGNKPTVSNDNKRSEHPEQTNTVQITINQSGIVGNKPTVSTDNKQSSVPNQAVIVGDNKPTVSTDNKQSSVPNQADIVGDNKPAVSTDNKQSSVPNQADIVGDNKPAVSTDNKPAVSTDNKLVEGTIQNKCIVVIKENTRASSEVFLQLNKLAEQPEKNTGKTMFLSDFETELPQGTLVRGVADKWFVAYIGHRTVEKPKFNGLIVANKDITYCNTDVTKNGIAKVLQVNQKFVLEKDTKVVLRKGTELKMKELNVNITLNDDLEVYLN
jgi:hypothetical protein